MHSHSHAHSFSMRLRVRILIRIHIRIHFHCPVRIHALSQAPSPCHSHAPFEIDEMQVQILPPEGKLKYLDDHIRGPGNHRHRIRCAWSAFAKHRQELKSQSYLLRHRLHLFDAVVTPTITCGAGTRAKKNNTRKMLRTNQRRMLRLIIQT